MIIISKSDTMYAIIGRDTIEWHKGSHTANVYNACNDNYDVFTFGWEKDYPTMLDFTTALATYLEYVDSK